MIASVYNSHVINLVGKLLGKLLGIFPVIFSIGNLSIDTLEFCHEKMFQSITRIINEITILILREHYI